MLNKRFIILLLLSLFSIPSLFASTEISNALKEKKFYPMGKKIYEKRCPTLTSDTFASYEKLLDAISAHNICSNLNKVQSKALAIYLWDKEHTKITKYPKLTVTKDDKCQVCGMFLHYYPTWVAQINYPQGETYKFDGNKDMLKFYFNNEKGIVDVFVQDYYTLETLDARSAYFVIGSDVLGPMGNELIAFKSKKSAENFALDHKGKKVLPFKELNAKLVHNLD